VKRPALVILLSATCLAAGLLAAVVATADARPAQTTTATTASEPTTTSTTSTTTGTTTTAEQTIADGVTIGGVAVGGMTATQAYQAVTKSFYRSLVLVVGRHRLSVPPTAFGAVPYALRSVNRALVAPAGTAVRLDVGVSPKTVGEWLGRLAQRVDRKAVDAKLSLRKLEPFISRERTGFQLLQRQSSAAIRRALQANRRTPIRLPSKTLVPTVTRRGFGPVIVIHRGGNRLNLYDGMKPRRAFGVATGQTTYPTPLGRFQIVVKWKNPTWYPPDSPWAAGATPIPPGPGNPLGTRWMGLSAAGVGIHGTYQDGSIGYSVSHGCIRMHIPDAEWLFDRVQIGTVVYIVAT
jgi:lipoprotein-anchoring transpeptidase ErfK/SrfK